MLIRLCRTDGPWRVISLEWDGDAGDARDISSQAEGQLAGHGAVVPHRINVAPSGGPMLVLEHNDRATVPGVGDVVQYATADHVDPPPIPGKLGS